MNISFSMLKVVKIINSIILTMTVCLINGCPEPPLQRQIVNCDEGYHLCGNDSTECCMDTTSHRFIWSVDTLGLYGSYLNDVAIINEFDIWVVGNIVVPDLDSINGTGYEEFNAARWNGNKWDLQSIYSNTLDLNSILYFSENDIWVCSGLPIYWDGIEWTSYHLWDMGVLEPNDGGVTQLWGNSSSNIYFVGRKGSIVHYDGSNFTKMESGVDVELTSVTGTTDGENVFAIGYDPTMPAPSVALQLSDGVWETIYYTEGSSPIDGNQGWIWGVGVFNDTAYFSTQEGLWKYNYQSQVSVYESEYNIHFDRSVFKNVEIQDQNDMFFGGAGFIYAHYNGNSWIDNLYINQLFAQSNMYGTDFKGNIAVMVGFINYGQNAVIARGYR